MGAKEMDSGKAVTILGELYGLAVGGIPKVSRPAEALAEDYLSRHPNVSRSARDLIRHQVAKCGASGFLSGLGGLITLPVALPANLTSVLYVQMRMVAALAYMGGFDLHSDQVQTMVYMCLTGNAASQIAKSTGIKFGEKAAVSAIEKIPGKTLTAINQKVGFRFLTKFGEKGIVNLGKMVPFVGGAIGGGIDSFSTRIIASNAYRLFIKKKSL